LRGWTTQFARPRPTKTTTGRPASGWRSFSSRSSFIAIQETTAPVVIPAEGNIPQKKRRDGDKWGKSLTVFRDALTTATKAHGRDHQPSDGPAVKAAVLDQVRAEHKRLYVNTGDGDRQAAERQAWSRALNSARGRNLVSAEMAKDAEMIWFASK
jgi:hypothetical protein